MHVHIIKNGPGNVVDVVPFCSDACHRDWCAEHSNCPYEGWNGCNEGSNGPEFCTNCGVFAGGTPECEHQRDNVVVNRFRCDEGEKCDHGHWIQLPARYWSRKVIERREP